MGQLHLKGRHYNAIRCILSGVSPVNFLLGMSKYEQCTTELNLQYAKTIVEFISYDKGELCMISLTSLMSS